MVLHTKFMKKMANEAYSRVINIVSFGENGNKPFLGISLSLETLLLFLVSFHLDPPNIRIMKITALYLKSAKVVLKSLKQLLNLARNVM